MLHSEKMIYFSQYSVRNSILSKDNVHTVDAAVHSKHIVHLIQISKTGLYFLRIISSSGHCAN
jgi:hypothetical protein